MRKTNVLRILEAANIAFTAREYDVSDGEISGVAVAEKIGQEPDRVFKTLVTEGKTTGLNVFVIPSNVELDLKKAASAAGDKYVEMLKSRELEPKTGYVHGGCIGLQIELSPDNLAKLTDAKFYDLF